MRIRKPAKVYFRRVITMNNFDDFKSIVEHHKIGKVHKVREVLKDKKTKRVILDYCYYEFKTLTKIYRCLIRGE